MKFLGFKVDVFLYLVNDVSISKCISSLILIICKVHIFNSPKYRYIFASLEEFGKMGATPGQIVLTVWV